MHFRLLLLLTLPLLFSSCFEAVEELSYTTKEAGNYQLTLNASRSREKLKALFKLDSLLGFKIPSPYEIRSQIEETASILRKTPGISQVKISQDFEQYIFSIRFHFDSLQALNHAIQLSAAGASEKHRLGKGDIYRCQTLQFQRLATPADSLLRQAAEHPELLRMTEGAVFTSVYRFTRPIASVSNTGAALSPSRKAVMLKTPFKELLLTPSQQENTITFQ